MRCKRYSPQSINQSINPPSLIPPTLRWLFLFVSLLIHLCCNTIIGWSFVKGNGNGGFYDNCAKVFRELCKSALIAKGLPFIEPKVWAFLSRSIYPSIYWLKPFTILLYYIIFFYIIRKEWGNCVELFLYFVMPIEHPNKR